MPSNQSAGIQLDEQIDLQHWQWRWQPIGLAILGLLLLGAMLGLFGAGPLANASGANDAETFTVHYQRFVRQAGASNLLLDLDGSLAVNGELTFWIANDALANLGNPSISPQPDSVTVDGDRVVYTLAVTRPSDSIAVTIHYTPGFIGLATLELGSGDTGAVSISLLGYP